MAQDAMYIIGNGKMAAVLQGGDHVQIFGPPYSSPALFASKLELPAGVERGAPVHFEKAGIWQFPLMCGTTQVGSITDFAVSEEICILRRFETACPVRMRLYPLAEDGSCFHSRIPSLKAFRREVVERRGNETKILLQSKNANGFYVDYPLPFPQYFRILVRGDAEVTFSEPFFYEICVHGKAELLIIGGPDYPACDMATERLEKSSYEALLDSTKAWWHTLFAAIPAAVKIPMRMPERERVIQAIEDTVICIVSQQAVEGGVLAGHAYHMGYVRDQFGVCMAMLKLGMFPQAQKMLRFYLNVFRKSGEIRNAQALGVPNAFHFAENDKTEITGYLLLQFFRYMEASGDKELLMENVDFLRWLYAQQLSQLHNGTLPFNGDETYIAGGLLPRDVINDGSAEATMLFLVSGRKLLELLTDEALAEESELREMGQTLEKVGKEYAGHFMVDGVYTLNDPTRTQGMELPQYRYGVCMNFGTEDCAYFGWTKRVEGDVYLCPVCQTKREYPKRKNGRYQLPSALLMPAYLGFDLPDPEAARAYLQELTERLERVGYVYSNEKSKMNVGYDYGLLLYNLVVYDLPGKESVCRKLLSLRDEAGVWSEYYLENQPVGTRYRAWESGINMDALLTYARAL